LKKSLWEKNVPANVYVGMRYWHPFTEEAIEQVVHDVKEFVDDHAIGGFSSLLLSFNLS